MPFVGRTAVATVQRVTCTERATHEGGLGWDKSPGADLWHQAQTLMPILHKNKWWGVSLIEVEIKQISNWELASLREEGFNLDNEPAHNHRKKSNNSFHTYPRSNLHIRIRICILILILILIRICICIEAICIHLIRISIHIWIRFGFMFMFALPILPPSATK